VGLDVVDRPEEALDDVGDGCEVAEVEYIYFKNLRRPYNSHRLPCEDAGDVGSTAKSLPLRS